jgi:hypothetical protein
MDSKDETPSPWGSDRGSWNTDSKYCQYMDNIIKTNDIYINSLKDDGKCLLELIPTKIRKYFQAAKEMLENYNDILQNQLNEVRKSIENKDESIGELESIGVNVCL